MTRKRDLSDPTQSFVYALPVAGFGLLLCSEGVSWLFGMLGIVLCLPDRREMNPRGCACLLVGRLVDGLPLFCETSSSFFSDDHTVRREFVGMFASGMCCLCCMA